MLVFQMSVDIAEEFWKRVIERNAETAIEREKILIEMANEGLMQAVSATDRTKKEYVEDISKEFKVLDLTSEESNEGC